MDNQESKQNKERIEKIKAEYFGYLGDRSKLPEFTHREYFEALGLCVSPEPEITKTVLPEIKYKLIRIEYTNKPIDPRTIPENDPRRSFYAEKFKQFAPALEKKSRRRSGGRKNQARKIKAELCGYSRELRAKKIPLIIDHTEETKKKSYIKY